MERREETARTAELEPRWKRRTDRAVARRARLGAFALAALGVALAAGGASAHLQGYAFAHADQPTNPSYTPLASRAYNDGGGGVQITRSAPGTYSVSFADFDDVGSGGGHVQVTSTDPGVRYCNVSSWASTSVAVRCYDTAGNLADGRFNVLFLRPGPELSDYAFAWVSNPTASTSTPSSTWRYNPAAGGSATVTRYRIGHYAIRWDDLDTIGAGPRVDLVTAYGSNARCQVDGLLSDGFLVRCHSPLGFAVDSLFTALAMRTELADDGWGFARVTDAYSFGYTLFGNVGYNAGLAGEPTVDHPSTGVYHLDWPGLDAIGINLGTVQVSADAFYDRRCGVDPDDGDSVTVRCFDAGGLPADTEFQVLFLKPPLKAWQRDFSFAYANDNISGPFPYLAPATWSRNIVGSGGIEVNRVATGIYHVEFLGTDEFSTVGHVQVNPVGVNSNHCNVETSYDEWAEIRCYNRFGSLANTHFNVVQVKPSAEEDGVAYARADQPTTSSYTANPTFSLNPAGNPITITRSSTGVYSVQFPGFDAFGNDGGNAQVSAFGFTNGKCHVASWGDDIANVRCFTTTGNPADRAFNVMLSHADSNDEALAYVWSTFSTSASFTPSATWAYQTGTGAITGVRNATGTYTITFDGMSEEGLGSGVPLVTMHGTQTGVCNPYLWGGNSVSVICYDNGGVPADRRFSLLYLKNFTSTTLDETYVPAPEPGFGSGMLMAALALASLGGRRSVRT